MRSYARGLLRVSAFRSLSISGGCEAVARLELLHDALLATGGALRVTSLDHVGLSAQLVRRLTNFCWKHFRGAPHPYLRAGCPPSEPANHHDSKQRTGRG